MLSNCLKMAEGLARDGAGALVLGKIPAHRDFGGVAG